MTTFQLPMIPKITYVDNDGDKVTVSSNAELIEARREMGRNLKFIIELPPSPTATAHPTTTATATTTTSSASLSSSTPINTTPFYPFTTPTVSAPFNVLGYPLPIPSSAAIIAHCPRGHLLSYTDTNVGKYVHGWRCDGCNAHGPARSFRHCCFQCTYDLCQTCFDSRFPVAPPIICPMHEKSGGGGGPVMR
jgi:hypothetical protein